MTRADKGLKKVGLRSHACGCWIITRDRPHRWFLRHKRFAQLLSELMALKFRRLRDARKWAEAH